MKLLRLLVFPMLLFVNTALSQQCIPDSLLITSQSELDDFLVQYPNCTEILGFVNIRESESGSITNLSGLQNITSIGGHLLIENNDNLTNLSGLNNLTSIRASLTISENDNLTSLSGLENLTAVDFDSTIDTIPYADVGINIIDNESLINLSGLIGLTATSEDLIISENNSLINLSGLDNLTSVDGEFIINDNENLINLLNLENLTSIGYDFKITNNNSLVSLSGLDNLNAVRAFQIRHNNSLTDLTGLNSLTSVGSTFGIGFNDALTSLSGMNSLSRIDFGFSIFEHKNLKDLRGLSGLKYIGSQLLISSNDSLTNFSGLDSLISVGHLYVRGNEHLVDLSAINNLYIDRGLILKENPSLSVCAIPSICNYIESGQEIFLYDNAPGCISADEVATNCMLGKIEHPIFYDLNEDGILDEGEPFYADASVIIDPIDVVSYGNFVNGGVRYVEHGDYVISYNALYTPNWELTIDTTFDINFSTTNFSETVFFGIKPTTYTSDISSSIGANNFRCNETSEFNIYGKNNGTTIASGTLWLEIDTNVLSVELIDTPDSIVAPNLYGWNFNELFPAYKVHKKIKFVIPGPPDFPLGDSLKFKSFVTYTDTNGDFISDPFVYEEVVECSYDPNDKRVSPVYPLGYALVGEPLIYTIRFQNTGNAEAYDVVIRDTLDSSLNPATFRVIASSHDEVLTTELNENQYLSFNFTDIFLPDSTTNLEESQGFVIYSIQAFDGIPEETVITNTAGIYFDLNPPIITNTTVNTMIYSFDADEDGFDIYEDCDDRNELAYPGAEEIPNNGVDEDCDGEDFLVSTKDSFLELKASIFPNPTTGILSLEFETEINGQLFLTDFTGKTVLTQELKQKNLLNLEDLANGVYLLKVKTSNGVWIERVVKI